jgi:MoaA/NifB/PqqE/SkfB family radical SAM enzyme
MFDEKISRLSKWAKRQKAPPTSIELIPTDRCNSNCLTCWRRSFTQEQLQERYKQEMSDERILKLIDEAAEIGVKEIAFVGGGEPLKREVTFQLIKKIKGYQMEGDLVTNGTLFTKEYIEMMVKNGWNRVKFSIDGSDAKTHDRLRGIKCFKAVIKNIKIFSDLKKRLNVEKPRLILNTVISNINYKSLPNIVKLSKKIGIEEILLLPMTVFSDSAKDMKLTEKETREFLNILKKSITLAKKLYIENNFSNFLWLAKTKSSILPFPFIS